MLSTGHTLESQRHKQVESKWIKKIHRVNGNQRRTEAAVLISDDTDFKALLLDRKRDAL